MTNRACFVAFVPTEAHVTGFTNGCDVHHGVSDWGAADCLERVTLWLKMTAICWMF